MPLQKQALTINFSEGLDQKTDPKQIKFGRFTQLDNRVFNKAGLLEKRIGFESIASLSTSETNATLSVHSGSLVAIGNKLSVYDSSNDAWNEKGSLSSVSVDSFPSFRGNVNATVCDSVTAPNKITCVTFRNSVTNAEMISVVSETGDGLLSPVALETGAKNVRLAYMSGRFIAVYLFNSGSSIDIKYVTISNAQGFPISTPVIAATGADTINAPFDISCNQNLLFIAFKTTDVAQTIKTTIINKNFLQVTPTTFVIAGKTITNVCCTTDKSDNSYASALCNDGSINYIRNVKFNSSMETIADVLGALPTFTGLYVIPRIASVFDGSHLQVFFEKQGTYSFSSDSNNELYCSQSDMEQMGYQNSTVILGMSIASKPFVGADSTVYLVGAYTGQYQKTYFVLSKSGAVVAKLAYGNAFGYATGALVPGISEVNGVVHVTELYRDQFQPVNKTQGAASASGIYSQFGLTTYQITLGTLSQAVEASGALLISGGYLKQYDGQSIVEHGFHLWPENIKSTASATGGSIGAGTYYYYVTYEWTDANGLVHRSAPSVAIGPITTTGSTSSVVFDIPTLRVTSKSGVRIVLYRWSVANPLAYQITSITSPQLNSASANSVSYTDTLADSSITGNLTLYTTGGVVEDIGAPAVDCMTIYRSRVFLVDAEDKNLLWFSKQLIESVPVEFSDLLTIYSTPSVASQGGVGPVTALFTLDDKLVIFRKNSIYYITGNGPDNTGANNDFSEPILITSTVGCDNPNSIAFMPSGLVFQSDKGIWLLGRDLSTQYLGAQVEDFNAFNVNSVVTVPATNQVRFGLSNGSVVVYDYYFGQWATFSGLNSVSGVIWNERHAICDRFGQVSVESNDLVYSDRGTPTLTKLQTGWINIAGIAGYQRAYHFYLVGQYKSPHTLVCSVAYDYEEGDSQTVTITPDQVPSAWGDGNYYGDASQWGGISSSEFYRVFLDRQKCTAIRITIEEHYDSTYGVAPGPGYSLSGINLIVAVKGAGSKGLKPSKSFGGATS